MLKAKDNMTALSALKTNSSARLTEKSDHLNAYVDPSKSHETQLIYNSAGWISDVAVFIIAKFSCLAVFIYLF